MEENKDQNENVENEENEEEDRLIYSPIDYDPNTSEKIVCIELENNQQIFVEYKQDWTVQNLITEVLTRKEFYLLQQNSYFSLEKLHELHILKNYRTPFFILKSNFTPDSYIYSGNYKLDQLKEIKDSKFNYYAKYLDYMPKMIKWNSNLLLAHPELEDYFIRNKRGYNEFSPFKRNVLTCDKKTIDWFIYDQESIKFLLETQKLEYIENSNLKYINGKIYFEDRVDDGNKKMDRKKSLSLTKKLKDKDLTMFFINLKIDLSNDENKKMIISSKLMNP